MATALNLMNQVDAVDRVDIQAVDSADRVNVDERRRQPRRVGHEHGVHSARVRPGIDARVLDISAEGALIETADRLPPGRRLILQLKFATSAVTVRGSVLRCTVFHASVDRIVYRGALSFERRLHWTVDATGAAGAVLD